MWSSSARPREGSFHRQSSYTPPRQSSLTPPPCHAHPRTALKSQVINLDVQWRECGFRVDQLKKDKNLFQKEVAMAKKAGGEDPENAAKIKEVATQIKAAEATLGESRRRSELKWAQGLAGMWSLFFFKATPANSRPVEGQSAHLLRSYNLKERRRERCGNG